MVYAGKATLWEQLPHREDKLNRYSIEAVGVLVLWKE